MTSGFGLCWLVAPLVVAAAALALLLKHRADKAKPARAGVPREPSTLYPYLKDAAWAEQGNALRRPLWDGHSSTHMPWVVWGGGSPLGSTMAQIEAEALQNLRRRRASWQAVDTRGSENSSLSLLLCADDALAAERILDVELMQEAQRRLGARGLLVGVPHREFLVAVSSESPTEVRAAFVTLVAVEHRRPGSGAISPLVFVMTDGAIVGIVEG